MIMLSPKSHLARGPGLALLLLTAIFALSGAFQVASVQAQDLKPELSADSTIAEAGFFRLSWGTQAAHFELQEATDSQFQDPYTLYMGPDQATVISGKADGDWFYRLRIVNPGHQGPWSDTVSVSVKHHSLFQALLFFFLGLIVFVATLLMIIQGTRTTR